MDKAREKTDKQLSSLERRVKMLYRMDPSLHAIKKEYDEYMKFVSKMTKQSYIDYKNAPDDEREERKKKYKEEVRKYTLDSKKYKILVDKFTKTMANVNQKALDLVNDEMVPIYTLNYNQMAEDCKKVGIEVNG